MTAAPRPSTVAHLDALTALCPPGYYLVLSAMTPAGWRSASFPVDQVDAAAAWAREMDDAGHNVYVRTNLLARPLDRPTERGRTVDTGAAVAFAVDIDIAGPGHKQAQTPGALRLPATGEEAESIVAELPPPSMKIRTGGGFHLWWLLDEPEVDEPVKLVEAWGDRIVEAGQRRGLHVDRPDPARVLRVAGTHRRKPGIPPNRVELVDVAGWPIGGLSARPWCPAGRYGATDLLERLPAPQAPTAPPVIRRDRRPGEVGPADAVARLPWSTILEPAGWTFTGMSTVDGTPVELWQRPGASSPYSLKAFPNGPAVAWSDACGLPPGRGQRLNKWRVLVHLHFAGDERAAASAIRRRARGMAA